MSNSRRNILITGGNFTNQGAYLMLCAAAEQIREKFHAQPVIAMQTGSERAKRWVGLDSLLDFPRFRVRVWGGDPRRLAKVRERLPFVTASEIDAVLDVSGFVFSDEWDHLNLRKRADDLLWWNKHRVPTVLMPQAFGPFAKPGVAAPTADLLDGCSLAVARDPDSERFLKSLAGSPTSLEKISRSTDFTTIVAPEHPGEASRFAGRVPIVPNWNIARRAGSRGGSRSEYVDNLVQITKTVEDAGYRVYGLCHEGGQDAAILQEVRRRVPHLEVVEGLNGRQSKWLLGKAPFAVSGRFHALVSALSQGVPAYAHGWSHKYRWLADEYKVSGLTLDPYADPAKTHEMLSTVSSDIEIHREVLSGVVDAKKEETRALWGHVGTAIGF